VSALAQEAAEVRRAQRPTGKVVDVNGAATAPVESLTV
jgi:hypothetical protein